MKKPFSFLLILVFALTLKSFPLVASNQALSESDYCANAPYDENTSDGCGAYEAAKSTINMSMLGWGLGLAIAIAIIAGVIHQSAAAHSSSSNSSNSNSS